MTEVILSKFLGLHSRMSVSLLAITAMSHVSICYGFVLFAQNSHTQISMPIDIACNATVNDLAAAILSKEPDFYCIVPESLCIEFGGSQLSPHDLLSDVGIGPETTISFKVKRFDLNVELKHIQRQDDEHFYSNRIRRCFSRN